MELKYNYTHTPSQKLSNCNAIARTPSPKLLGYNMTTRMPLLKLPNYNVTTCTPSPKSFNYNIASANGSKICFKKNHTQKCRESRYLNISSSLGSLNFININSDSITQNFICKRFGNSCS
jgi:hypothetical protein